MDKTNPLDLAQFEGHTPGPWRISKMEGGRKIAVVNAHGGLLFYLDVATNGNTSRLLAAAPALLAECKRQREQIAALRSLVVSALQGCDPLAWNPKARAALAATEDE